MRLASYKATPVQLQWLVWILVVAVNFASYVPMDGARAAAIYTIMNAGFYALIIYGNIYFLYPRLYLRNYRVLYVIVSILFLLSIGLVRIYLYKFIYTLLSETDMAKRVLSLENFIYFTLVGFVIFILSFVFRIALAYFKLKQQAERMQEQKSLAELNLLKSQVQPHFLFNTLNNIYYEAYREAPRTALLIGRLSEIMRYFVDQSPREKVSVATEIQFLENYIALEKIRIRHGVKVSFTKEVGGDYEIPPMLLMTFVENIFKHGIDRSGTDNKICLSLEEKDGYLHFQTGNELPATQPAVNEQGFGLRNLKRRLNLLYGDNFELVTTCSDNNFLAHLKIPLL